MAPSVSSDTVNSSIPENHTPYMISGQSTIQIISEKPEIKVYKKRFWILLLYVILATLGAMLFPQHISTANVTGCYYGVTQNAVNWTTQIFLLVYVVFIVPASFLMNYLELRWSLIFGSALNTAACAFQFLTSKTDGFPFVIVSSAFGSLASLFIMGNAPYLAAKWFPTNELSRACAVGVFGNQIGVSIGLMFSPLLVSSNCEEKLDIESGKTNVAIILTAANAIILILLFLTFQKEPKIPPSQKQLEKSKQETETTANVILSMLKNFDYMMIFVLGGLMAGVFYTFTTIANNLMIRYFPHEEVKIALMTTLFSLFGIVGSIVGGHILDFTHKFKETSLTTCISSLLFCIIFSSILQLKIMWLQFVVSSAFGYFVGSFLPIGLEYGIETIYPASEMISSNLIFWSMQFCGVILIQLVSNLLDVYGPIYALIAMGVVLLICCVIASFTTRNYKRSIQT